MAPSIGTVGDALDNALQESTIGLYKTELIEHDRSAAWSGAAEVERETASWVHWVQHHQGPSLHRTHVTAALRGGLGCLPLGRDRFRLADERDADRLGLGRAGAGRMIERGPRPRLARAPAHPPASPSTSPPQTPAHPNHAGAEPGTVSLRHESGGHLRPGPTGSRPFSPREPDGRPGPMPLADGWSLNGEPHPQRPTSTTEEDGAPEQGMSRSSDWSRRHEAPSPSFPLSLSGP